MKPFEFALVIVSVIIGLALTEFAIGVADMIKIYKTAHIYWAHILLSCLGFVTCLNYWATLYKLKNVDRWTTLNLVIVVVGGLLFFIMARVMFPDLDSFDNDYRRHFHENIGVLLILNVLFIVFIMLEAFLIRGVRRFQSYLNGIVFISLLLSAILINNEAYTEVLTVIYFAMYIYFMVTSKVAIFDRTGDSEAVSH